MLPRWNILGLEVGEGPISTSTPHFCSLYADPACFAAWEDDDHYLSTSKTLFSISATISVAVCAPEGVKIYSRYDVNQQLFSFFFYSDSPIFLLSRSMSVFLSGWGFYIFTPPLYILGVFLLIKLASVHPHCRFSHYRSSVHRAGESYSNTLSSPLRVKVVNQTPGEGEDPSKTAGMAAKHYYLLLAFNGLHL